MNCFKCGHQLELEARDKISRYEQCPKCYADMRCCRMCLFFDESKYNECAEPIAQRITDKEKANFCEYFKLNDNSVKMKDIQSSAKSAAEALFKKS